MILRFSLMVIGLLLLVVLAPAQSKKDLIFSMVEGDSLINSLVYASEIDKSLFQKDTFIQKLRLMLTSSNRLVLKIKPSFELGWDGYYITGNGIQNGNLNTENELFSRTSVATNSEILGLPIRFYGQITMRNQIVDRQLSDFSVTFDQHTFLQSLHQRLHFPKDKLGTSTDFPQLLDSKLLRNEEKAAIINEVKHRMLKAVLDHPLYLKKKNLIQGKLDSLTVLDSLKKVEILADSLRRKYGEELKLMNNIEEGYRQTWDYKSLYNDHHLVSARAKLNAIIKRNETWSDPRAWMKDTLLNHLKPIEKALVFAKNIDLGQFNVKGSDFTLFQMPLQGVHTKIEGANWFAEVAQGRQRFQQGFAPSYGSLFFNPRPNKHFTYLKAGFGQIDGGYVYVALLRASQQTTGLDSLSYLRKSNIVWEVSGKMKIYKNTGIELTGALSKLYNGLIEQENSTPFSSANGAVKANLVFGSSKKGNKLGVGYFFTGPSFVSFGNTFLHNNWSGLNVDARLSLLHKRLFLNGSLKYGAVADQKIQGGKYHAFQFFGQAVAKISNTGTLSLSCLPNVFTQSNQVQDLRSAQNMYQFQFTQLTKLGESDHQLSTSVGISNYRFNYQLLDTLNTNQVIYGTVQETFISSSSNTLSGLLTFANRDHIWFRDWLSTLEFGRQLPNIHLKSGLQALSQSGYKSAKWGVSLGLQTKSKSRFSFSATCIYRKPFFGKEADQMLGNISTHYIF